MLLVAVGAIGGFLEVLLPQQVVRLAGMERSELNLARKGATDVNASVSALWADLSPKGSFSLPDDRLAQDLALAKGAEKAASDTLGHVQAAEAYSAQADGLPFQFHAPAFIATDRPALLHLEAGLAAAVKLAHGATVQITLAQHLSQDSHTLASLNASVNAGAWANAAGTAATLATDLKSEQVQVAYPEALLDPLWGKWVDAMLAVALDAQQLSLDSAANHPQAAQQDGRTLAAARDQLAATASAAQNGAAAWQTKIIQPLLDTLTKELAAGG